MFCLHPVSVYDECCLWCCDNLQLTMLSTRGSHQPVQLHLFDILNLIKAAAIKIHSLHIKPEYDDLLLYECGGWNNPPAGHPLFVHLVWWVNSSQIKHVQCSDLSCISRLWRHVNTSITLWGPSGVFAAFSDTDGSQTALWRMLLLSGSVGTKDIWPTRMYVNNLDALYTTEKSSQGSLETLFLVQEKEFYTVLPQSLMYWWSSYSWDASVCDREREISFLTGT